MLTNLKVLSDALRNNLLVPFFQSGVEMRTGLLVGFAVLARWKHDDHGLVLPANLISLAGQNGLAEDLMPQGFSKALGNTTYCAADSCRYVSCNAELRPGRRIESLKINTPGAAVLAC